MRMTLEQLVAVTQQVRRIDAELESLSGQEMSLLEQTNRAIALNLERAGLRHRLVAGSI